MTTTLDPMETTPADEDITSFADRVFGDFLGAMNVYAIAIGERLGWYDALAAADSMTSSELASSTDSDERYAREWLEQQTVAGYLDVDDASADLATRRFRIRPSHAEVLANPDSLAFMTPFAGALSTLGTNLDRIIDAYRTGDGVGWDVHGDRARCGQAAANRPLFLHVLAQEYLASIDDVHATLSRGARVADVGCGLGWSSIGIALAYPQVHVDGFDIDRPSIEMATANAVDAGVDDRVRFRTVDVGDLDDGGYDVALALECIHDMPDPVAVLSSMRSMVGPDGVVIVMDERVGDAFTGEPDPVEQLLYGFSLVCCLPDGRNAAESVATGTVMRRPVFENYARQAGFSDVTVLPIENDLFRFYRLFP